ncbi:carbohydrate ABC transporter permease [Microbacterium sp. NE2HP2]|jgi:raffinose/stachyose/melibiose transport system permease protein|uniref:Raffinose/stachyose/melibiose transport system permease protein n=2 Tax=Microbacterium TaxID=33882 RepID=A0ABU1I3W1_9MICO|nr:MULTISPECIES: carbohydrate ABC transporter permease [Microbacterium]APF34342.1 thiamine ABC transporter ATP-binding protein [Microbacterium paludicola]MDD7944176.1 carbohydrate ABC transporter permease [Microbacterium plantarum]MDR6168316.1 raffinose/stachyose/melibiose transport system permease protein [Microbacterium paludicola]OAZ40137.1 thiamine ABC transporter ATP-binding protein [Microbacterium arborescens]OWP21401.1 carbohydrate ABC transporter permease [Microbacterium sp. AISO3]
MTALTSPATRAIVAPAPTGRRGRRTERLPWGSPVVYFVALVVIALMLAPVLYIIIGGFRSNAQITVDPAGWPSPWNIENYLAVLTGSQFWQQVLNSTIAAGATTIGAVLLGLMASYILARYRFRGRGVLYAVFASGLMFPITVAITPLYIVIRDLGLMNSLAGIILPQIAFALPMTIIILVPFLRAIPDEIQEAAFIDGCGRLSFFWRMVLPLSVPGVITVGILAFIGSWNSYLLPLFILNNEATFTLPLGVQAFSSQYSVDTAKVLAFTSLSMLPALAFFSLFERRIVGGLTGAVKG